MFNINHLLDRMRAIRNSDVGLRTTTQAALKKHTNIDVPIESIQVKSGRVSIKNIPGAARAEIFMKKTQILEEIKNNTGSSKIVEIN
ncbi:MAG: hypothetical protein WCO48_00595 [Candidatus Taylorbacteria bacterium]